jgi:hypothetical protein
VSVVTDGVNLKGMDVGGSWDWLSDVRKVVGSVCRVCALNSWADVWLSEASVCWASYIQVAQGGGGVCDKG